MPEEGIELYKLIEVHGEDAAAFLQGQLTQNIDIVRADAWILGAWCNAKGRVFALVRIRRIADAIGLLLPASMAEQTLQRLLMYRLRAKVSISLAEEEATSLAIADIPAPAELIALGVPTINEHNSEKFTPHMLNLDKLGAISFSKGCYIGQEVVARTENLGKSKRRMMRYRTDGPPVVVGDKLTHDGRNVGEVVNVSGAEILAVSPVDLHGVTLTAGKTIVLPASLPYEL